jgi:hypothetical protein
MSTGYQISEQYELNFVRFQIAKWIDIFTRKVYRDIVVDSLDGFLSASFSERKSGDLLLTRRSERRFECDNHIDIAIFIKFVGHNRTKSIKRFYIISLAKVLYVSLVLIYCSHIKLY